jgi:hypothetical protein
VGASWKDLREVCQKPVRDGNDVAGLLFGDHASLVVTKVFVDLRLSPNYASIGFLVCGLVGAAMQVCDRWWAVLGAFLLVMYYVLDCVDGEVARWQKVVNVHWGYFDYLFHMLIKPVTFFGIGLGAYRMHHEPWLLCAAFATAVATLWRKILIEIPGILFLKDVLKKSAKPTDASKRAILAGGSVTAQPATPAAQVQGSASSSPPFKLRADLVTGRAIMTNFDISLLLLLVATSVDCFAAPLDLPYLGVTSFRALWLLYYAIVLPLDFLDYLITFLRRRHFSTEMTRLLGLAHHFRADDYEKDG